jgi:cbb3-type cytochrome oxidase cytochrome c subunit
MVGEVVVVLLVVVVVLVVVVGVVEDVVGDLAQDAKTRDITNRKVNAIQITPFFISTSLIQLFKDSSS